METNNFKSGIYNISNKYKLISTRTIPKTQRKPEKNLTKTQTNKW